MLNKTLDELYEAPWLMLVHYEGLKPTEEMEPFFLNAGYLGGGYFMSGFDQDCFQVHIDAQGLEPNPLMTGQPAPDEEDHEVYGGLMQVLGGAFAEEQYGNPTLMDSYGLILLPSFATDRNGEFHPIHKGYIEQAIARNLFFAAVGSSVPKLKELLEGTTHSTPCFYSDNSEEEMGSELIGWYTDQAHALASDKT